VPSSYIPPDHSLIRNVSWSKLRKDADDNVVGVLPDAFVLRVGENELSTTWLEYFSGNRSQQIIDAVHAIRCSNYKPGPKGGFAIGVVRKISAAAASKGTAIRVLHEPEDDNVAHAVIRRWPRESEDLFDLLADEIWNELVLNAAIPNEPLGSSPG
jgi:hypothetical protein